MSFLKIEIINDFEVQVIPFPNEAKEVGVPLNKLDVGNYTISVFFIEGKDGTYIYSKTVVFKIARLLPIMEFSTSNLALNITTGLDEDTILMPENFNKVISARTLKTDNVATDFSRANVKATNIESLKNLVPPRETREISFDSKKMRSKNKPLAASIKTEDALADNGDVIFVPYSLSDTRRFSDDPRYVNQSREAYRKENLRPNGKPYN
ncbi:hypothetical protein [Bizionia myxarmorum]|uniref:Uncharacterized protein n=1 Tax=Bizionia myxarmorum TaxID=291186 RepID=A0A5D0R868_9FLAO|nr:hypothetical protein [Bizionia myxarmorum]TYB76878.1 hypothetical protein ES674_09210 [Bizionia myxarmorum]